MSTREPKGETILAARIMRAYPSLSAYSAATLAEELCRIGRAQRRHAERCCSGEDGGYVRRSRRAHSYLDPHDPRATVIEHDPEAEERAGERIGKRIRLWQQRVLDLVPQDAYHAKPPGYFCPQTETEGDPRGRVLLVRLPGESEAVGV